MPTKLKLTTRSRDAADRSAGADIELLDIDQVGSLLDELQDDQDSEVCVWRAAGPNRPREQWLFSTPATSMTLPQLMDKLRDDYGGGDFRIRGRKGSKYHGGSRTIGVEPPAAGKVVATSPAAPANGMPSMGELITLMFQQNQAMMTNLVAMANNKGQAAPGASFTDLITAAKMLSGQGAAPSSPLSAVKEILEVQELLGKRGGTGSGEDGDTDWLGLLKSFAPVMQQALAQSPGQAAITAGDSVPAAAAAPTPAPAAAAPAQASPLVRLVARLVKAARLDSDPEAYAIFVIDEMGEEAAQKILAQPDSLQKLSAVLPPELVSAVAERLPWFQELLQAVQEQLQPDDGQGSTNGSDADQRAGHESSVRKSSKPAAANNGPARRAAARS